MKPLLISNGYWKLRDSNLKSFVTNLQVVMRICNSQTYTRSSQLIQTESKERVFHDVHFVFYRVWVQFWGLFYDLGVTQICLTYHDDLMAKSLHLNVLRPVRCWYLKNNACLTCSLGYCPFFKVPFAASKLSVLAAHKQFNKPKCIYFSLNPHKTALKTKLWTRYENQRQKSKHFPANFIKQIYLY